MQFIESGIDISSTTEVAVITPWLHRQNLVCDSGDKDWVEIRVGNASHCVFCRLSVSESNVN
jgi:hypothetical protein